MKKLLLLISIVIATIQLHSQCNYVVPPTAYPYPWGTVHAWDNDTVLVCGDKQMEITGQNNLVLVEYDVWLTLSNNKNIVVMKGPGLLDIDSDSNTVYIEAGITVNDNGVDNNVMTCSARPFFDFTNGPKDPCNYPVGINSLPAIFEILVSPNPSSGVFNITNIPANSKVNVFGITGASFHSFETSDFGDYQIDMSSDPKGLYFISIELSEGKSISRRINLQ